MPKLPRPRRAVPESPKRIRARFHTPQSDIVIRRRAFQYHEFLTSEEMNMVYNKCKVVSR